MDTFKEGASSKKRQQAAELTNQAFFLVERKQYDSAIDLLQRAIEIDPTYGHAYNELAYVYGKAIGNLDLAEGYAWHAVKCDPNEPKFLNAFSGILIDRLRQLKTRRTISENVQRLLEEIQHNITNHPKYPPAYLAKAIALALGGEPRHIWQAELKLAEQLYLESSIAGAGAPISNKAIRDIIIRTERECIKMSDHLKTIPD